MLEDRPCKLILASSTGLCISRTRIRHYASAVAAASAGRSSRCTRCGTCLDELVRSNLGPADRTFVSRAHAQNAATCANNSALDLTAKQSDIRRCSTQFPPGVPSVWPTVWPNPTGCRVIAPVQESLTSTRMRSIHRQASIPCHLHQPRIHR